MSKRLIELRKNLKISQAKLAEDLNLSRTFINLVENGNRELSDRTILDICRIYGVNVEWFRTGKGEMFAPVDRETEVSKIAKRLLQAEYDDIFAKFVTNLSKLNQDELIMINNIIKKLAIEEKDSSN